MKTSDTIEAIAAALAKAQSEMKNAIAGADNPFFKSKYAELSVVRDAVTPALTKNGIAVVQMTEIGEGFLVVCTRLIHSSGQWIESQYPITNDVNKPQAMGSAMTYARRYSLSAICGIASEKDDDGNEAAEHGKTAPPKPAMQLLKRDDARKLFATLKDELVQCKSEAAILDWEKKAQGDIDKLGDWKTYIAKEIQSHTDYLLAKQEVAAE